jgi:multimeric flavodoxin WrbA
MVISLPNGRCAHESQTFYPFNPLTPFLSQVFWDATGQLWQKGSLAGKYASMFVSTGTVGGQEMTVVSSLSTLTHHGIIFVPLGYSQTFDLAANTTEGHGGESLMT